MVGIWLLVPELLRLGAWDLLCAWSRDASGRSVQPRLAMHVVNEAALCFPVRNRHGLTQKGFELANGLPFVPTDQAVHELLDAHDMQDGWTLQQALGRLRRASGHYQGRILAIDPHHMRSHSKRQTRRHRHNSNEKAVKTSQSVFLLDADTNAPLCSCLATSSRPVSQTTSPLLAAAAGILPTTSQRPLVLADGEYFAEALFAQAVDLDIDLLVPLPENRHYRRLMAAIGDAQFTRHWPGYATATVPFHFASRQFAEHKYRLLVQRQGEQPDVYAYTGFLCTAERDEMQALSEDFPDRWHVEEFFNRDQALGWKRAGTLNLNIRYNQLSLAMVAQAAIHQLRHRLPQPCNTWNAQSLADHFFNGIDGDIRVHNDTVVVTFYNAPECAPWRTSYEHLPTILNSEGIDPKIPWLYGFKLDFRFK